MFLCIDMKCFFASVECVLRGLDPSKTPLVVADPSRGKGALCLAISPYLKELGASNRCRLYELSRWKYVIAKPRMQKYIDYAVMIHNIFLNYVSSEDIHTYSIDEAFIDITSYEHLYPNAEALSSQIINDIHKQLGLIAVCGIGDNIFLAKLALDIKAKHSAKRIYYLSKEKFFSEIWNLKDLTSIWQIGKGLSTRLNQLGLFSLKDIAYANPKLLEDEFGVIGKDLYEHAWGSDETKIQHIKAYIPKSKSISRRQILMEDYCKEDAWIPLIEMLFLMCLELVSQNLKCNHLSIFIGYKNHKDQYHKSWTLPYYEHHYFKFKEEIRKVYSAIPNEPIRVIGITLSNFIIDSLWKHSLFDEVDEKYESLCQAILLIWNRYDKNKLVMGTALLKQSTIYQRNQQIGGHNRD